MDHGESVVAPEAIAAGAEAGRGRRGRRRAPAVEGAVEVPAESPVEARVDAGAEVPAARSRLEALLGRMLPGCRLSVVHDTRLVLAAAGLDSGIALVAGTGSVAYGRTANGREAQRGGWGWMLGDDGSGVWIAREAAREIMSRAASCESWKTLVRFTWRTVCQSSSGYSSAA